MRARNLKPSFFANEILGSLHPLARLLFQGLWCEADCEGRLEDRPLRLKSQILPYDQCDVECLLNDLSDGGFIVRYKVDNDRYIQVINFKKHQNPHVNEKKKGSEIPAPEESDTSTVQAPDLHQTCTRLVGRNPDSLFLIPDSGIPLPDSGILIPEGDSYESLAPSDAGASSEPANDEAEPGSDQPQKVKLMPRAKPGETGEEYHRRYMAWVRNEVGRLKEANWGEWATAYPAVDIETDCARAIVWLNANPEKRKKKISSFLSGWFSRTQERGGNSPRGSPKYSTNGRAQDKLVDEMSSWISRIESEKGQDE